MGCGGSKSMDSPLVNLCRERKLLVKTAADQRYALAAAHLSYFSALRDVGDALRRFVEEEIVADAASECSSGSSPVLTLPSDEGKNGNRMKKGRRRRRKKVRSNSISSSSSLSVSGEILNLLSVDGEGKEEEGAMEGSHLHLSDSEVSSGPSGHIEIEDDDELNNVGSDPKPGITYTPNVFMGNPYGSYSYPYNAYHELYYPVGSFSTYYVKKVSTSMPSVIYEEPKPNPIYMYPEFLSYQANGNAGFCGFNMGSRVMDGRSRQKDQQPLPPPAPPSPEASSWDYFNPFKVIESNVYPEYYKHSRCGYGSNSSSPDSNEVREREGIPDLEEETENEVLRESFRQEKSRVDEGLNGFYRSRNRHRSKNLGGLQEGEGDNFGEGTSNVMAAPKPLPMQDPQPDETREIKVRSPGSDASTSNRKEHVNGEINGVRTEVEGPNPHDIGSSKISNLTVLATHGMRDLREVAGEIKDEFCAAVDYGKEVSLLLETDKLPYQSRGTFLGVRLSRFLYSVAPAISSSLAASNPSPPSSSSIGRTTRNGTEGLFDRRYSGSLAATLDKLYMWEKKLYEEVKAEERLRIRYEKQCKKLKWLDERGADTGKVEAMQASIRKLLTKIDVSIKAVEAISTRIHKLRDDELQPQITDLVLGLRRMWSSMLKSHQRQFQAILESKTQTLKANTGLRQDSSVRATLALEMQLLKWSSCFNQWIDTQRFYAESLNGWLSRCLLHQPEETPDGIVPFSPGRIGAPPVFVICHDWNQVMDRISESAVKTAMHDFATSLHQLWERQDEEQRRRLKADHAFINYKKQIHSLREVKGRNRERGHDSKPDRVSLSMVHSKSGVLPLDDLKVDLDTLKQKVRDQRAGHKEAVKLVHDAVSRSIQAGLIPIFEALERFTLEAAKAYEIVRVQVPSGSKS